jgi:zinc D-Ala-D-Ala carboxypeptidase
MMLAAGNAPRVARVTCLMLAFVCCACGLSPMPTRSPSALPTAIPTPVPTPDMVAPTVVSQDPPPGGQIPTSGVLHATFSEPVSQVDGASFELSDPSGAIVRAAVTLDATGTAATLVPDDALTIATAYTARLTGVVHDDANNRLAPLNWQVITEARVVFAAGTYDGYRFGATTADMTGIKRAAFPKPSSASASEYRVRDGTGYLLIDSGLWKGYWMPGTPGGTPLDDQAASIPPLPTCAYLDLPATRAAFVDWGTTVLDTVFALSRAYALPDLVDTSRAGLNGGHLVRSLAVADLAAMVAAAKAAGAHLAVQSAYRSYGSQVATFNGWVQKVGYQAALRVSARPGHSEHQLGTAIDFRSVSGPSPWSIPDWAITTEGAWMTANSWRYGWVLSYPRGASAVSCYTYEPWHFRYVGRAIAQAIHDSGATERAWLWAQGYGVR